MKKILAYIVAGLSILAGFLAVILRMKSMETAKAEAEAVREKAKADHSVKNAEALANHQERVDGIKDEKEDRDEKINSGNSSAALADIIAANNNRVPDDD